MLYAFLAFQDADRSGVILVFLHLCTCWNAFVSLCLCLVPLTSPSKLLKVYASLAYLVFLVPPVFECQLLSLVWVGFCLFFIKRLSRGGPKM